MKATKLTIVVALVFAMSNLNLNAELKGAVTGRVINPEKLLPVSAGGPGRPAKEKKGDLEVRVMVLENNGVRVAFVSEPFLGFPAALSKRITDKVEGIPAENILIGATHTHSAPDPYGFPSFSGFSIDMDYMENIVCARSAEAINEAVANLKPVKAKIATGEAHGKIAYNYYAPQLYDPRCSVIQLIGEDGKAVGTLVNYAIHPEVLIDEPILSPDVIGPLYDRIAEQGGGVGVFMNGAQGGMITADVRGPDGKDIGTWEECIRIGSLLADEALRIVSDAQMWSDPVLHCAALDLRFPEPTNPMWRLMANSPVGFKLNEDKTLSTRVNVVNLGNAQILTIPGEALPNIGYYLKRKMKGEHNMLFGLTNDAFGYILTKVDFNSFKRYDYISETSLGEMTGEVLIEKSLAFIDTLPEPQKQ